MKCIENIYLIFSTESNQKQHVYFSLMRSATVVTTVQYCFGRIKFNIANPHITGLAMANPIIL